jgi:hypothetical protein
VTEDEAKIRGKIILARLVCSEVVLTYITSYKPWPGRWDSSVDVYAPGVNTPVAIGGGVTRYSSGGSYGNRSSPIRLSFN